MEKTSAMEALFILGVVAVGVGAQIALGMTGSETVARPIVLALFAVALWGVIQWVRGRRRTRR